MYALPAAMSVHWEYAGIPGGIPAVTTTGTSVKTYGAKGDGVIDDTYAFERAISQTSWSAASPKRLYVPAGTYKLTREITLPSGCVLYGDGSDVTHLRHNFNGAADKSNFKIAGSGYGTTYTISGGYTRGSTAVTCASAGAYSAGDVIMLFEENNPTIMYTQAIWNVSWAQQMPSEMNIVESVAGSTINLTYPLEHTFTAGLNPRVKKVTCTKSAGIENVKLSRADDAANASEWNALLFTIYAYRCWLRNTELSWACHKSLMVTRSLQCEVRGTYSHHAYRYASNQGDALIVCDHSTRCLVVDNVVDHLNAMFVDKGAIANVFFANHTWEAWDTRGDGDAVDDYDYSFDFHGHFATRNLVEHNTIGMSAHSGYWGPCPSNVMARNRCYRRRIQMKDKAHWSYFIGNELTQPNETIMLFSGAENCLLHGNVLNGVVGWASGTDTVLPASFYLAEKPSWWGDEKWPAIGPDVVHGITPAERRWLTGAIVEQP